MPASCCGGRTCQQQHLEGRSTVAAQHGREDSSGTVSVSFLEVKQASLYSTTVDLCLVENLLAAATGNQPGEQPQDAVNIRSHLACDGYPCRQSVRLRYQWQ